ncbi:hypothetical protein ACFX13_009529 [Malus domestica]
MASAICGRPLTFFTSRSRSHNHPSDQMPVFLLLDSSSPIAVILSVILFLLLFRFAILLLFLVLIFFLCADLVHLLFHL